MTTPPPTNPTPPPRSLDDLRTSGVLWLVNKVALHPRGFALGLTYEQGEATGWTLLGDGTEPFRFPADTDRAMLAVVEATLARQMVGNPTEEDLDEAPLVALAMDRCVTHFAADPEHATNPSAMGPCDACVMEVVDERRMQQEEQA